MPVTEPENQAICFSRACRSRTRSPPAPRRRIAGPGVSRLCSSSSVGLRVRLVSEVHVFRSTAPVASIPRLSWKPSTAVTVVAA